MLGVVLGLCAALGFGTSTVFARVGLQYMRPTTGTLVSLFFGIIITMTLAFIFHSDEIFALSAIAFLWFLVAGIINFPLGRLLNYTSVGKIGVARAAPIVGASPLFAAVLAVTIGGESMNIYILGGTIAIIGGLALILSQK